MLIYITQHRPLLSERAGFDVPIYSYKPSMLFIWKAEVTFAERSQDDNLHSGNVSDGR